MPPFETRKPSEITVGIGLSGGVDSAASANILREHGFNVVGLCMMNWNPYIEWNGTHCSAESELSVVRKLCSRHLDIPLKVIEFDDEYFNDVLVDFIESLSMGFCTPNPDTQCARRIAFGALHHFAFNELSIDFVATGHYASTQWTVDSKEPNGYRPSLRQSAERRYDQSYFLSRIDPQALYRHLFPIGSHFKEKKGEIRSLVAQHFGDEFASKRSSTGLCYVDGVDFKSFLSQFVDCNEGDIVDSFGRTLGRHKGLSFWTIGQRLSVDQQEYHRFNRLAVRWFVSRNVTLYVLDKNVVRNQLIVATECHSKLFNDHIIGFRWNVLSDNHFEPNGEIDGHFRFRDKDDLLPGFVRFDEEFPDFGHIHLTHDSVRAATPGQIVAMYDDDGVCIASAIVYSVCS